jgi:hypothetical protein
LDLVLVLVGKLFAFISFVQSFVCLFVFLFLGVFFLYLLLFIIDVVNFLESMHLLCM